MKKRKNIICKINLSKSLNLNYRKTLKHILKRVYLKNKFYLNLFSYKNQNFFINKFYKNIKFNINQINSSCFFNYAYQFKFYNYNKKNKFLQTLNTNSENNIDYFKKLNSIYIYKNNKTEIYCQIYVNLLESNLVNYSNFNTILSDHLCLNSKLFYSFLLYKKQLSIIN